ncbi:MAG: flavin reductase family protein [Propioniciclava sp.]
MAVLPDADPGAAFKEVFRFHPAAVAVITTIDADGPVGLTASSVASVATDPPCLSFSVTRARGSAGRLLRASSVDVHLLRVHHVALARTFAIPGSTRFTDAEGWRYDADGSPLLPDARATLRCQLSTTVPVGSSTLVIAEVTDIILHPETDALLYADRRFGQFDPDIASPG